MVVSGCASGIDGMAMEGALETDAPVIGILGCGVDVVYPAKNRKLFSVLETEGCLISEYPPGEQPLGWHFPERNRIITGISNGLLVVEAPLRSGALISARHAMEQGRDVFVVPGWHVVREYEGLYPDKVCKRDIPAGRERAADLVAQPVQIPLEKKPDQEVSDKKSIDKKDNSSYSVVNNQPADLQTDEQRVLSHIGTIPCPVDDVIALTGLPAGTVKTILTKLTIKGFVRNHPGGRISRK